MVHWKNRAILIGSLLLNNTVILCWIGTGSLQNSQFSLAEEGIIWATHMIWGLQFRNCRLVISNLEFYHKTKADPTYDTIVSINSILTNLSFCGFFFFAPVKSNMVGQTLVNCCKNVVGRKVWYPNKNDVFIKILPSSIILYESLFYKYKFLF